MSAADNPVLPPELVTRFKAALDRLNPGGGKIGLAVSGGPDSMAMLLLAHEAIPGAFEVATVNHGLRPEAADECALVAAACAERGVECAVLEIPKQDFHGNLLDWARIERYFALEKWAIGRGIEALATAHHADDQAETLVMRLNRASGLAGLSGVREYGRTDLHCMPILRPLLQFRREELLGIVEAAGMRFANDPSNLNDDFERVRTRQALAQAGWLDPIAWATSAAHLADDHDALQFAAAYVWSQFVVEGEGEIRLAAHLPPGLARILAARILDKFGTEARGKDLARLMRQLDSGGPGGNIGGILITREGNQWLFRPEPPRRPG